MILNAFLGDSDRIEILESFLDNEEYGLSLNEIKRISEVSNPTHHIKKLIQIGILYEDEGKYFLNQKDKRVICLSLIDSAEYSRQLKEVENNDVFKNVTLFSKK